MKMRTIVAMVLMLAGFLAAAWFLYGRENTTQQVVSNTSEDESAIQNQDAENANAILTDLELEETREVFQQLYPGRKPDELDLYSLAGELAVQDQRFETALQCFRKIPTDHPDYGLAARTQEGAVLTELNRLEEAEASLLEYWAAMKQRDTVQLDRVIDTLKRLDYLLSLQFRFEDRKGLLADTHRVGIADIRDSKHLFFPNLLVLNSTTGRNKIAAAKAADPASIAIRLADARYQTLAGEFEAAVAEIQSVLREAPDNMRAHAYLLEAYSESGDITAFEQAAQKLPKFQENEPWLLTRMRAEYTEQQENFTEAEEYYRHVLSQDPANAPAQSGLARVLGAQGKTDEQKIALERVATLAEIRVNLNQVRTDDLAALDELIAACEKLQWKEATTVFQLHANDLKMQRQEATKSTDE